MRPDGIINLRATLGSATNFVNAREMTKGEAFFWSFHARLAHGGGEEARSKPKTFLSSRVLILTGESVTYGAMIYDTRHSNDVDALSSPSRSRQRRLCETLEKQIDTWQRRITDRCASPELTGKLIASFTTSVLAALHNCDKGTVLSVKQALINDCGEAFMNEHARDLSVEISGGLGSPNDPTNALPGTEEKIMVLAARCAAGVELWHPEDRKLDYSPVTLPPIGSAGATDPDTDLSFDSDEELE